MSNNVSSRLQNQDLVRLAQQNYEKQQRVKVPPVVITLPSKGLIYPESSPLRSGKVEMRHMTAYDEDILSNSNYLKTGVVFDKLLESLIVTPGVHVDDISPVDREGLLISARIYGYGKMYPVLLTDPKTNNTIEREIDLSKLNFRPFTLQPDENGEFEYRTSTDDVLKFRFLTFALTKNIDPERAVSDLMLASIQQVNENRDKNYISEYLKFEMLALDARTFRNYLAEHIPGIDFSVEIMLLVIIWFVLVCVCVFKPSHGCVDAADTEYIHAENVPFWKSAWVNVFATP